MLKTSYDFVPRVLCSIRAHADQGPCPRDCRPHTHDPQTRDCCIANRSAAPFAGRRKKKMGGERGAQQKPLQLSDHGETKQNRKSSGLPGASPTPVLVRPKPACLPSADGIGNITVSMNFRWKSVSMGAPLNRYTWDQGAPPSRARVAHGAARHAAVRARSAGGPGVGMKTGE